MVFSSFTFIFLFLPVTILVYYLVPARGKNGILLAASLLFYSWGEPVYIILMLLSILFNYFCGREIDHLLHHHENARQFVMDDPEIEFIDLEADSEESVENYFNRKRQEKDHQKRDRKRAGVSLAAAIALNLSLILFFKYLSFIVENINHLFGMGLPLRQFGLPLGISFYTFQGISYLVDIFRGEVKAQKRLIDFALYISLFSQLIAGPIVRYVDMEKQLYYRKMSLEKLGAGARWFIIGLSKKVILANRLGEIFETIHGDFLAGSALSVCMLWLGALAYTLQIYFDFSGYSDMAIGLAKMFGFDLKENFHTPYIAVSITDFWRRWHISLGTWFREYVYIPLGGNRKGRKRQMINLTIVWFLTGLWHGAQWNFVVWGMYYGVVLMLEKFVFQKIPMRMPLIFKHVYVMVVVVAGWVFFFSPDLHSAGVYLNGMTVGLFSGILNGNFGGMFKQNTQLWFDRQVLFVLHNHRILWLAGILGCTGVVKEWFEKADHIAVTRCIADVSYILLFLMTISYLVASSYNPFIYFRF